MEYWIKTRGLIFSLGPDHTVDLGQGQEVVGSTEMTVTIAMEEVEVPPQKRTERDHRHLLLLKAAWTK